MEQNTHQITDANLHRVSEGLRVIEEYTRFIINNPSLTDALCQFRKQFNKKSPTTTEHLLARHTETDTRAKEPPSQRPNIKSLLTANFKRIQEGLRVLEEYTGDPFFNSLRYDAYDLEKDIMLTLEKPRLEPGFYQISDNPDHLEEGLKLGAKIIQIRDKYASKETLFNKAKKTKALSQKYNVPFIVNDFIDIAILTEADGLHTGQDDIPLDELRKLLGPHKLLGRTTHTLDQGKDAQAQGADYVSIGPIWETPSKPGRPGIGFDYLEKHKNELHIPVVAIGGINRKNIEQIRPFEPFWIGVIRDYKALLM